MSSGVRRRRISPWYVRRWGGEDQKRWRAGTLAIMPDTVWINGEFVAHAEARVSAFDAGFQHGVGLFETMLAVDGAPLDVARHIERLIGSAAQLGLSESLRVGPLIEAVKVVAQKSELPRARLRLTVTGGDLNMLASTGQSSTDPTILIVATRATEYPREMLEKGVRVTIADTRVNPLDPFAGHKTLNYWLRLRALQEASAKGAGEAVFFQVTNHIAGGAVSNLFIVKEGALHTPIARGEEEAGAIASPVLPGITRQRICELADPLGVGLRTGLLSIDDLLGADEAFLTNSSWGVLPIVQVEAERVGEGSPGEITRRLQERWGAWTIEEASALGSG